jgi:hypothetical protein
MQHFLPPKDSRIRVFDTMRFPLPEGLLSSLWQKSGDFEIIEISRYTRSRCLKHEQAPTKGKASVMRNAPPLLYKGRSAEVSENESKPPHTPPKAPTSGV